MIIYILRYLFSVFEFGHFIIYVHFSKTLFIVFVKIV